MKHSIKILSVIFFAIIIFSNINCEKDKGEAPEKPTVVSPEDNTTLDAIPASLEWKCTDVDSKDLTYDVYFGKDPPLH